jgi:hypothetical protein
MDKGETIPTEPILKYTKKPLETLGFSVKSSIFAVDRKKWTEITVG